MKKLVSGCIAVSMVLGMMAGSTAMAADDALDNIKERGKLIVATDAAWPPFEYMEGENVVGVDVDIAQDIADGLGVDLEVINVAFDSLSMYLENGEADLALAAITVTEDRAESMEFSDPSPGWLAAPGGPAAGLVFILLADPLFNEGSSFGCSLVYMV